VGWGGGGGGGQKKRERERGGGGEGYLSDLEGKIKKAVKVSFGRWLSGGWSNLSGAMTVATCGVEGIQGMSSLATMQQFRKKKKKVNYTDTLFFWGN
jgi:hypothetical protein